MALKYVIIQHDGYGDETVILKFDDPIVALDVAQQYRDRSGWSETKYRVEVWDA